MIQQARLFLKDNNHSTHIAFISVLRREFTGQDVGNLVNNDQTVGVLSQVKVV
jgi:hypothetical protein